MRTSIFLWLLLLSAALADGEGVASGPREQSDSRWTTIDGVQIHYRESGTAVSSLQSSLLLVHGWMGSSYDFHDLMERLPPSLRVVAPDLPGSGLSQKTGIDFSVAYYLQILDRFATALGIEKFVLIGHSMGGGLAVNFAVHYPDRVQRLILIDPDGLEGEEGPLGVLRRMDLIVDIGTRLNSRFAIGLATRLNVFEDPALVTEAYVDSVASGCLSPDGRRAQAEITKKILGNAPVDDLLPFLTIPTLIMWGEQDRVLRPRWAREYARRISGAKLVMIPESGHMPQIEAADLVTRHILQFLDRTKPGT